MGLAPALLCPCPVTRPLVPPVVAIVTLLALAVSVAPATAHYRQNFDCPQGHPIADMRVSRSAIDQIALTGTPSLVGAPSVFAVGAFDRLSMVARGVLINALSTVPDLDVADSKGNRPNHSIQSIIPGDTVVLANSVYYNIFSWSLNFDRNAAVSEVWPAKTPSQATTSSAVPPFCTSQSRDTSSIATSSGRATASAGGQQ
jgi:hypothetical protein